MKTREEIIASCPIGCDLDSYLHGYANGYTDGELEKPNTPEGLDEAAEKYFIKVPCSEEVKKTLIEIYKPGIDAFKAGAEWQADHTPLPEDTVPFNKGVEEGKRLMMEEAVEGIVEKAPSGKAISVKHENGGYYWAFGNEVAKRFNLGDKVCIIIVKED